MAVSGRFRCAFIGLPRNRVEDLLVRHVTFQSASDGIELDLISLYKRPRPVRRILLLYWAPLVRPMYDPGTTCNSWFSTCANQPVAAREDLYFS